MRRRGGPRCSRPPKSCGRRAPSRCCWCRWSTGAGRAPTWRPRPGWRSGRWSRRRISGSRTKKTPKSADRAPGADDNDAVGRRKVIKQLEALQADVTAWQDHHRKRVRHLERQVTDIELSVARAEADAHHAALLMWDIETNLLRRIEEIEQRMEIRLLMRQGRIPAEALELLA